jgi:hypothetical protein
MNPRRISTALLATAAACFWLHSALWIHGAPRVASAAPATAPQAMTEIRAFFDLYLRLFAEKKMTDWSELFLSEANCVSTSADGGVSVWEAEELAKAISDEAAKLESQRETFEDTRTEVHGNSAMYSATWRVFHNGKEVQKGRAYFSLVKKDGAWKIAALVRHRD